MALPLNAEMLAAAYDYLCCTPPFNKMNMPHSEDIKFSIGRRKNEFGRYQWIGGDHHMVFSSRNVGRHLQLLQTMSHEMAHLFLEVNGMCDEHGPVFQKLADKICKHHPEFDRLNF